MKILVEESKTETIGMLAEESFGIGNIGLLFDILRNRMYKDRIQAVCREIMCNARDAHREVGTPERPIQVCLPTSFSPYLKIKDFGPGISPERMSKVFIQYANSTKRDDNLQTGGFGLGAKTPFSYSDSFSIVTIVDGIQRTYNAFIDESKVGKIVLAASETTEEPNGTTIVIPILAKDFSAFYDRAAEVSEFWDVKPDFMPASVVERKMVKLTRQTPVLTGTGWVLEPRGYYNTNISGAIAIVDGIKYQIDLSALDDKEKETCPQCEDIIANNFIIYFQNGEVSLIPSRDSLQYDDRTKQALMKRLKALYCEVVDQITKEVKDADSFVAACCAANTFSAKFTRNFVTSSDLKWKDKSLRQTLSIKDIGKWAKCSVYNKNHNDVVHKGSRTNYVSLLDSELKFYWNDLELPSFEHQLVRYLLDQNPQKNICIISTPEKPTSAEYERTVKYNGNVEVKYDMDLLHLLTDKLSASRPPKVKQIKSAPTIPENIPACILTTSGSRWIKTPCVINPSKNSVGGFYLSLTQDLLDKDPPNLHQLAEILGATRIYGVTPTRVKRLGDKWKSVQDELRRRIFNLESELSLNDLCEDIKCVDFLSPIVKETFRYDDSESSTKLVKDFCTGLNPNGTYAKYVHESLRIETLKNKYLDLLKLANYFGIKELSTTRYYFSEAPNREIFRLKQESDLLYPLLEHLPNASYGQHHNIWHHYLNLVDGEQLRKQNAIQ